VSVKLREGHDVIATFGVLLSFISATYLGNRYYKRHIDYLKLKNENKHKDAKVVSFAMSNSSITNDIDNNDKFIRKKSPGRYKINHTPPNVKMNLEDVLSILKNANNKKINNKKKVKLNVVDNFLYNGHFNSVLGPDGFKLFKEKLKGVITKVNKDDFVANYLNLDKTYEALLASGVYYEHEFMPDHLKYLDKDERWLTAYRYIAKNFPDINYKDFRNIVSRLKSSGGSSFYIKPTDNSFLKEILNKEDLFVICDNDSSLLIHLDYKELKLICDKNNIQAAKSSQETVERIIEANIDLSNFIPKKYREKTYVVIKDQELANGNDLILLDKYLRDISKTIRKDFEGFIRNQRWGRLAA